MEQHIANMQTSKQTFLPLGSYPTQSSNNTWINTLQASKSSFHLGIIPKQQYLNKYTASNNNNNNRQQQSLNHHHVPKTPMQHSINFEFVCFLKLHFVYD
jgi:subtilase family serine protease